ncbi:MAG: hypothetical protein PUE13_05430 [Clostridiales bacterium]|nr:hypothetical protein [Clostridiales bacterium]
MLVFYDFEFNLLLAEPRAVSVSWELYYNGVGSFEAHLPLESEAVRLLAEHDYLVVCDDIACAVVVGRQLDEELVIYGRTCNWLLEKRIAEPSEYSGNAAELACTAVQTAFSDVASMTAEYEDKGGAVTLSKSSRSTVLTVVTELLSKDGMGHSLDFDYKNKRWVFRAVRGKTQPLLISEANKNAYGLCLTDDILDLATCGVYDGGTYDSGTATGIYRWQTILNAASETEAKEELAACSRKSELTLKMHGPQPGVDYRLGDKVRVQTVKGALRITERKRIAGMYVETGTSRTFKPIFENVTEED